METMVIIGGNMGKVVEVKIAVDGMFIWVKSLRFQLI